MKGFIFALAVSAFVTASKGKFIHFSVKQTYYHAEPLETFLLIPIPVV